MNGIQIQQSPTFPTLAEPSTHLRLISNFYPTNSNYKQQRSIKTQEEVLKATSTHLNTASENQHLTTPKSTQAKYTIYTNLSTSHLPKNLGMRTAYKYTNLRIHGFSKHTTFKFHTREAFQQSATTSIPSAPRSCRFSKRIWVRNSMLGILLN